MTLPTPPRYVVLPEEVIEQAYAPDKPRRALLASFTRILSLAWEAKYQNTPALNEEDLMEFLKLSRRQYFEQKADMELLQWLRSSHPRPGFVQFTFSRSIADKLDAEIRTVSAEKRTDSLIGGGDSTSLNPDSSPSTPSEASAENRTFPNAVQILAQTNLLFDGSVVSSKGLENCLPMEVLAWCAYAFHQKNKLSGPAGLVRRRLLDQEDAPLWTTEQWPQVLPERFLEALQLLTFVCEICESKFKTRRALEEHSATHSAPVVEDLKPVAVLEDESVLVPIDGHMNASQAWQAVLGQLQMEMPRASFDTWVRDTKACRYGRNTLQVGVRNAYARDWLADRLQSTAQRLLVGILAQSVTIEFVVSEPVEDL
jgi:DnaA-like protein